MNKPVYIVLPILEIRKKVVFKFWYDYRKKKYRERAKFYYMGTKTFVVNIKNKKDLRRQCKRYLNKT